MFQAWSPRCLAVFKNADTPFESDSAILLSKSPILEPPFP